MLDRSRRRRILDNVVATLQALKGPPFSLTVEDNDVIRSSGALETAERLPTIYVLAGSEVVIAGPIGLTTLKLDVTMRVVVTADPGKVADAVEDALADVRFVMVQDTSRGGEAVDTLYRGAAAPLLYDQVEVQRAAIDISFDVIYRTLFDDPVHNIGG